MYGIIYKITNLINGKVYIGQTTNSLKRRWSIHKVDKPYKKSKIIPAIKKYGFGNFNICEIDSAYNREELDYRETYWIKFFDSVMKGYNILEGGRGHKHSNYTKEKFSLYRKTTPLTPRQVEHLNNLHATIGDKLRGIPRSIKVCEAIGNKLRNRKNIGKVTSEQTKQKLRNNLNGHKSINKKVRCIETNIIYNSIKEVCVLLNRCPGTLTDALKKKRKICNFTFELI